MRTVESEIGWGWQIMANPSNSDQKQGMSTQKKWLIGCGGCLGVILFIVVGCAVLAGLGWNAIKGASSNSVSDIFGKDFKTDPYMAFGIPLGQSTLKNMVFLYDQKRTTTVFAVDTTLPATEMQALENGDAKQIKRFLRRMSEEAARRNTSNSSSSIRNVQFNATKTITLPDGKRFPLSSATVESARQEVTNYTPAVAALIPEADNRLIALIIMDPSSCSKDPDTDFSPYQANLQTEITRLITSSALDTRLISTKAMQPVSSEPSD
jgi:hypothetical protein